MEWFALAAAICLLILMISVAGLIGVAAYQRIMTPRPVEKIAAGSDTGWMSDVQRAIALMLIGTFATLCVASTLVVVWTLDKGGLADMAKTLQAALVNMALIALGFFFGNTMAKMTQDAGQQKVVEKLTSAPPQGPVAPVPSPAAPIIVVSWWSLMSAEEQAGIEAAAKPDGSKIKPIYEALISGTAQPPDIVALIAAGLLKPERQTQFKTA